MNPWHHLRTHGVFKVLSNTVPYIIDFYLTDDKIEQFVRMYRNAPLVFISSRQVFDYLISKNTGLNLRHLPLSLSDKYQLDDEVMEKKTYDIILLGRISPTFEEFLTRYLKEHPGVTVARKKVEGGKFNYYDEDDQFVGNTDDTREDYMNLMQKSRFMLYTTPRM